MSEFVLMLPDEFHMVGLLAGVFAGDLFSFEASELDPGDGGPPRGASW